MMLSVVSLFAFLSAQGPAQAPPPDPTPTPETAPLPAADPSGVPDTAPAAAPAPSPTVAQPVVPLPLSPASPEALAPDFFAPGQVGSYLVNYGAEYLGIAAVAGLYLAKTHELVPPGPALIGPRVDLDNPDLDLILDPRLDDVIGMPYLQEKVPNSMLAATLAITALTVAGADFADRQDLHRTHAVVLGSLEAVFGTVVVTEVVKASFGRLRPNFRERWLRAACVGAVERPQALDCAGVDDGFALDRGDVLEGMRSFPSGHASSAFAMASFATLTIGSNWIWGDNAPDWGPPLATVATGLILGGAGFIAASRVEDHQHHLEDIVVGAGVGATVGTAAWLLHFTPAGEARHRGVQVSPVVGLGGAGDGVGLALAGAL